MPNPFRAREADLPNAIVGSARRVHLNRRSDVERQRKSPANSWQDLAWHYYDEIGEVKFAFNYFAGISSRVRLYAGFDAGEGEAPAPFSATTGQVSNEVKDAAATAMNELNATRGGQPNLIRQLALNLLVAGEAYLVGVGGSWSVRSTSELEFDVNGRAKLITSRENRSTRNDVYLPDDAYVLRVWRNHPRYSDDADSSLRGVLKECSELLLLGRLISTSVNSRLNAGILYVADELRFQRADSDQVVPQPDVDPFEEELTLSLTEAITDDDSPSNIIPIIVRGPAELADKAFQKIDLSREFDETVVARHDQTLQRVINGIDIPRDILAGFSETRYSNAQTISEDMLKAYIEPLIVLLAEALTVGYLRPKLVEMGFSLEDITGIVVWYDPSEVVTRPDRSEDADKGWDRKLISGAAWRRSHGFTEADKPTNEEVAERIALDSAVTPDITLEFLRAMAPELVAKAEQLSREAGVAPATGETQPSDHVPVAAGPSATPRPSNPQGGTMPPRPVADITRRSA